ncbi:unnamed protein product [Didymodactylos carnosus]|uniref:Mevalonate kinase n=1 Tax=Didymodactylos carnosus TaxID=1234261 RepID=A0A813VB68_9BILA|nr:unnamed protein product [Didymodactylos carnosus]CAF0919340.1 unnamed protein product [Didymodactylos carnosus]CAF3627595.1 unnamed protein product [Didymodactylos carnosus]CAF3697001.1 unnamed protein product [Didymodactylos carnosus]
MTLIFSSPGKLILSGEHAVVYGKSALVTSINLRLYMQIESNNSSTITVNFDDKTKHEIELQSIQRSSPILNQKDFFDTMKQFIFSEQELNAILYVYLRLQLTQGINLIVRSQIPIGAGLGSSAAYSTCLIACFYCLSKHISTDNIETFINSNRNEINELAYEVECLFHGTPSGIDNTISTFGSSIIYKIKPTKTMVKINLNQQNLLIIDTGIPKSTLKMVESVRKFIETKPDEGEMILNDIETCVNEMIQLLEGESPSSLTFYQNMNQLFMRNQQLLTKLGVSNEKINEIVRLLSDQMSIEVKITGAGGGGCLIALLPFNWDDDLIKKIENILHSHIKSIRRVQCSVQGLCYEKSIQNLLAADIISLYK